MLDNKTIPNDAASGVTNEMLDNSEIGLTKREYIAAHVMAILTGSRSAMLPMARIAKEAVMATDALIEALNDDKGDDQ